MSANTILDRIETFLEIDGSSANSFAGQIGVDPGNMRKMLAGKQTITDRTLRKISDTFQLSFEWLKYGEGEMYNNSGDILAMQRIEDFSFLPFGDIYGDITTNGKRTIKRLGRSDRDGHYRLIPTNKDYDAQDIPIKAIAVVYRVLGAMKSF